MAAQSVGSVGSDWLGVLAVVLVRLYLEMLKRPARSVAYTIGRETFLEPSIVCGTGESSRTQRRG